MTAMGAFDNDYEDYSEEGGALNILNDSREEISEVFLKKLRKFNATKLNLLKNEMQADIFYDGSVYTGSCGLALYYYLQSQKLDNNHEMLKISLNYIDLKSLKGRRISFLCGDAGPLALATVISSKFGDKGPENFPDCETLAQRLSSLITLLDNSPDELLYGKSGYLYSLLFVTKHAKRKDLIPANHIEKVIDSILKSGKQFALKMKSQSPLLWQWHEKIYFGAAHGMAGILYMLLQAQSYINAVENRRLIKSAIDWLLEQRFPSGNFPSSLGSSSGDRLVQWCHGAPGFVPLCIIASQVFEENKYMKIALDCGNVIWKRGLCSKGYSICHGVSGNAYAFIQLYQATKQPVHLYRACCFMEWCASERPNTELHRPDRPASLFEGLLGRLYLAEDLMKIQDAKFPAFTV